MLEGVGSEVLGGFAGGVGDGAAVYEIFISV